MAFKFLFATKLKFTKLIDFNDFNDLNDFSDLFLSEVPQDDGYCYIVNIYFFRR